MGDDLGDEWWSHGANNSGLGAPWPGPFGAGANGLPRWMWILLSSVVVITPGLDWALLDLWSCQLFCRSGLMRNTAWPMISLGSGEHVLTVTICTGELL
ncbi:hypothetical protein CRUP_031970 [Coryphaenoides rupestris]|nr:hypothetical protein CRUP_031970 [Coryphaenoides rupestris]